MKFCTPNLPKNKVKSLFVSAILSDTIKDNLTNAGITTVIAPLCKTLRSELKFHPDIVLHNVAKGKWLTASGDYVNNLLIKGNVVLQDKYPLDCQYNCFIVDGVLYGGKSVADEIKSYSNQIITVAQGYTKCSTVILSKEDYITSDITIFNALKNNGKNVLKVTNGGIKLNGYSCGFIGGCTGVLGNKELCVTGKAELLEDYQKINDFCRNIGYTIISLSNDEPYDYGGLLPITEAD